MTCLWEHVRASWAAVWLGVAVVGIALAFAATGAAGVQAQPAYRAIDLGTLGGAFTSSAAVAINDHGMVIGNARTAAYPPAYRAFVWTAATGLLDLGTLGGGDSRAVAVNESGQVVGSSTTATGQTHAFSWTQWGGMVDLGTLGGSSSKATALNDKGQVVGSSATPSQPGRAFLWTQTDGMIDLGTLGTNQYGPSVGDSAAALNNAGQVVGWGWTASAVGHPFLWTKAGGMIDLGTLGGTARNDAAGATAVNELGQVVGTSNPPVGPGRAFFWTHAGGMVDLGTLGGPMSSPSDINNRGQVVGESQDAAGPTAMPHAFLWTQTGGMIDLGTLQNGWYSGAAAVNEQGQVTGTSAPISGIGHAYSWTAAGGMVDLGTLNGSDWSRANDLNDSGTIVGESGHATLWTTDATPPKLSTPADITSNATGPTGTVVTYTVGVTDDSDRDPTVSCTPPSWSTFAIGTTTVRCTATDAVGNTATATFNVHVTAFAPIIGKPLSQPNKLHAGRYGTVSFRVTRSDNGAALRSAKMTCDPTIAGKRIPHSEWFKNGRATLSFRIPKTAKGKLLRIKLTITYARQSATRTATFHVD